WVAHVVGLVVGMGLGPLLFPNSRVLRLPDPAEPTLDQLGPMHRPAIRVSFQEPMDFPAGTSVYRTHNRLVAVLPDWTLIADDGTGGIVFDSATDYRENTGDEAPWTLVR